MRRAAVLTVIGALILAGLSIPLMSYVSGTETSPTMVVESHDLMAGKTTKVGVVEVWNDADTLFIKVKVTAENWCLTETHLAVATSASLIPQTKTGNAIPGQFPYAQHHDCATEYTYEIPLQWAVGTKLCVAFHAVVQNTCTGASETAWGSGTQFNTKGNWAMYFCYTVKQYNPPSEQGTYTIGYWKNHAGFGPQDDMVSGLLPIWLGTANGAKSVQVTTAAQAVAIFDDAGGQNKIDMLYAQMLAAKLNIANGADGTAIASAIADADLFLASHNAGDWGSLTAAQKGMVGSWATTFDQYNNGIIGPGHA